MTIREAIVLRSPLSYFTSDNMLKPLKDTDVLRLYHGFNDFKHCLSAVQHGISGKERADRRYSYEYNNNPKGLFVTLDFKIAKEFSGGGAWAGVMEFHAKASDLEAPVWPGGSYTVQGGMEQWFSSERHAEEREAARMDARKRAIEFAQKQPGYFDYVAQSDRPELAFQLFVTREAQALFIGDLNPNMIRAVWVREKDKASGYQLTNQPFTRLSRREFLHRFGSGSDGGKLYKPAEDWKGMADLIVRITAKEKYDVDFIRDALSNLSVDNVDHMLGNWLWPRQLDQIKDYLVRSA